MTLSSVSGFVIRRTQTVSVRSRRIMLASGDAMAWMVGILAGTVLRYDFSTSFPHLAGVVETAALAAALQVIVGTTSALYRGRWRVSSFDEAGALGVSWLVVVTALLFLNLLDGHPVPESAPLIGGVIAIVLMMTLRYIGRVALELHSRPSGDGCTRLIVFGAGEVGRQIITSLLRNPNSPYVPVALLDDNPTKRNLSIMGVPVAGTRYDMRQVSERFDADTLLIAVRAGGGEMTRALSLLANDAGLQVNVVPSLREVIEGRAQLLDIRRLQLEDFLGRRAVQTDLATAAGYLTGRRVLVTGAGGSIGSELCRQIHRFSPAELIMVDRDESALHALQLSIEGRALLDDPGLVLLDIRDRAGLDLLFSRRRPEVVFHAAALKHLTMLEMHPGEAVQTNVWGTLNVLEAAVRHGVERFVNISTDKAVEPCSVLGYSKRIGERLTATAGLACPDSTYLSVRFGNVLGSRGSVLHTFSAQINAKGPITITHPDVRRYFMTVEEAIQLVIHGGAVGSTGEALVLDMGEPVRIAEVAQRLIAETDNPIEVVYTGLRPGEKLDEVLFNDGEPDVRPCHPLISHVTVPALHPGRVLLLDPARPEPSLRDELRDLAYSAGFRGNDKPGTLDFTAVDLDPGVASRLMDAEPRAQRTLDEDTQDGRSASTDARCRHHRRWSDRDARNRCTECAAAAEGRAAGVR
jgi:FlaA1/EpsC-like NDP-sugar epimerase